MNIELLLKNEELCAFSTSKILVQKFQKISEIPQWVVDEWVWKIYFLYA